VALRVVQICAKIEGKADQGFPTAKRSGTCAAAGVATPHNKAC
jgi:hypothetical protein